LKRKRSASEEPETSAKTLDKAGGDSPSFWACCYAPGDVPCECQRKKAQCC
jgi:hypothetical protein